MNVRLNKHVPDLNIVLLVMALLVGVSGFTPAHAQDSSDYGVIVAVGNGAVLVSNQNPPTVYGFDVETGQSRFQMPLDGTLPAPTSLAIDGNIGLVGDVTADSNGRFAGAAYVVDLTSGERARTLFPSDAGEMFAFGRSVDVDGGVAIVGAVWLSPAAYVFDVNTGEQLLKLISPDLPGDPDQRFGRSVGISSNTIVVGAPDETQRGSGTAYVFDASTGEQRFRLTPPDESIRPQFGSAIAIDGDRVIVGEWPHQPTSTNGIGAVDVFDVNTAEHLFQFRADDVEARHFFGGSVDVAGNLAVVGAQHGNSAYVFDVFTGERLARFTTENSGNEFGKSVAIYGNRAVIGSYGSAHVFDLSQLPDVPLLFDLDQPPNESDTELPPNNEPDTPPPRPPEFIIDPGGSFGDDRVSLVYDARTGELGVDAPAGVELTSINIDSADCIFDPAVNPAFGDTDLACNIFIATFGRSFDSRSFGNVTPPGLSEDFLLGDLSVIGSLAGGRDLGDVDLIYVPEPACVVMLAFAALVLPSRFRRFCTRHSQF